MSIINCLDEWSSKDQHFPKKYSTSGHEIKNVPMLLKKLKCMNNNNGNK